MFSKPRPTLNSTSSMNRWCYLFCAFLTLTLILGASSAASQEAPFALRTGDRVVFYGDSITEQRFYTWWTEVYVTTRFPRLKVQFFNAGVGGDRVSGGSGGDIDTRLQRDVFSHNPTVVTIMLGMNDGQYVPLTPAIEGAYRHGYQHILDSIHQHAPDARILIIGPSPYDETTRGTPLFPGGYNTTLVRFGQIDKELAAANKSTFTDANAPFVEMLRKASAKDNFASQMLVPDRVHPDLAAHLLIAYAVLSAWNAPPLVSKTCIDSKTLTTSGSSGAAVDGLSLNGDTLSWTSEEQSLPFPLWNHAETAFVDSVADISGQFNQEIVQVTKLDQGTYHLRIDDSEIKNFTAAELDHGVDLAALATPMLRQAQSVEWIIRDKGDLQATRTRILIAASSPNADAALTVAERAMEEKIWQASIPKPHHFTLTPVRP